MKRIFTYSLLALALGYASPAFADDNAMVSAFSFSVDEAAIEVKSHSTFLQSMAPTFRWIGATVN